MDNLQYLQSSTYHPNYSEFHTTRDSSGKHLIISTKHCQTMSTTSSDEGNFSINAIQDINLRYIIGAYFVFAVIYIYAPIISIIVFSFNQGGITAPFTGVTFNAYSVLFADESVRAAISHSLQLALVVTVIATVLSTAAGLAYRYDFEGRQIFLYLLILGIITPGVTYAVGAQLFLTDILSFSQQLWLAVPVHVVWVLPFAVIVILAGFPPTLRQNEQAARVMGADTLTIYREIVIPQIVPTVLGAAVFAFTLSYNEAERGLLLVGQDNTMPTHVFATASADRATPDLFALGSLTTVLSTALLLVAGWLVIKGISRS